MVSANIKGAILMTIARFAFVTNDVFMKFLFVDMSVFQAMFLRGTWQCRSLLASHGTAIAYWFG